MLHAALEKVPEHFAFRSRRAIFSAKLSFLLLQTSGDENRESPPYWATHRCFPMELNHGPCWLDSRGGKGKLCGGRQSGIEVATNRCIANCEPPIDQPLLDVISHFLKPSRVLCKFCRPC